MINDDNDKLPVTREKSLINLNTQKFSKNFYDFLKRVVKISKNLALAGVSVIGLGVTSAIGIPVLPTVAFIGTVASTVKAANDLIFKSEPSLIFVTNKGSNGERIISQNALEFPSYLRGISISDKACIMGLQTLIGFQRYKTDAKINGEKTIESDGKRTYEQEFSTVTHSVNLNNLQALADAGYIEIVKREKEFQHSPIEKIFGIKPRPLKSLIIMEQIGFANTRGLKQIFKALKKGDKQELEGLRKDFEKVTFRLTDKDFDFEDIYKKINGYKEYESKDEQRKLKRLRAIFSDSNNRVPGVLSGRRLETINGKYVYRDRDRKINIKYDKYNRPFLDYDAEKSFGEQIEEEYGVVRIDRNNKTKEGKDNTLRQKTLDEKLKEGVDVEKFSKAIPQKDSTIHQGLEENIKQKMGKGEEK